jgi:hypothetical protein
MEPETKKKLVPSGCDSEEFTRFNNLLRDVLKVPKKEIQDRERTSQAKRKVAVKRKG